MSRGMEGPTETLLIAGGVMAALAFFAGASCTHNESPKAKADHQCEVAWVDANDGDPETQPAPVIRQPWCQMHTTAMTMEDARP